MGFVCQFNTHSFHESLILEQHHGGRSLALFSKMMDEDIVLTSSQSRPSLMIIQNLVVVRVLANQLVTIGTRRILYRGNPCVR